jgi:hypothetical protein
MSFKHYSGLIVVCSVLALNAGSDKSDKTLLLQSFTKADSVFYWNESPNNTTHGESRWLHSLGAKGTGIKGYSVYSQKQLIGYGLATAVRSKSSVLPVLVALDTVGGVVRIHLPSTPDPYSARLQAAPWLGQFRGKRAGDTRRTDAMSGATRSAADVSMTVDTLLAIFSKMPRFNR